MDYKPDENGIIRVIGRSAIRKARLNPGLVEIGGDLGKQIGEFKLAEALKPRKEEEPKAAPKPKKAKKGVKK